MGTLTGGSNTHDGMDAHELLQNSWLTNNGISTGRTSAVGSQNPAIALPTNTQPGIHQTVGQLQAAAGLNNPANVQNMTAQQNIDANAAILRQAMVQHGVDPVVADAKVAELKKNAETYADQQVTPVKPCKR